MSHEQSAQEGQPSVARTESQVALVHTAAQLLHIAVEVLPKSLTLEAEVS